jgi:phage gpG-like protein
LARELADWAEKLFTREKHPLFQKTRKALQPNILMEQGQYRFHLTGGNGMTTSF